LEGLFDRPRGGATCARANLDLLAEAVAGDERLGVRRHIRRLDRIHLGRARVRRKKSEEPRARAHVEHRLACARASFVAAEPPSMHVTMAPAQVFEAHTRYATAENRAH